MRRIELPHSCLSRWASVGQKLHIVKDSNRPILLKKSTLISSVEKYALEVEIFTLNRRFPAQISCSGAQKRIFSGQYVGDLEEPTFSTESTQSSRSPRAEVGFERTFAGRYYGQWLCHRAWRVRMHVVL
ncbi:hypothetical protein UIA24_01045 [Pseudomonas sp. AL 58]|uniref:hypothetical protein n=1 Tax=Pseudomonas sp. AL 58 TaxID=3104275 RepID=UPI002EC9BF2B|nr:hypothetical protein [Pseudomonas sp. AL 58]